MGLTFQSETNYTESMYDSFFMTKYPVNNKQYINAVPIPPGVEIKLYKYFDKPDTVGLQFYYKGKSTVVKEVPGSLSESICQKLVIKLLQELPGLDPKLYTNEYFFTDTFSKPIQSNHSWSTPGGITNYITPNKNIVEADAIVFSKTKVSNHGSTINYDQYSKNMQLAIDGFKALAEKTDYASIQFRKTTLSSKSAELPGIKTLVDVPCECSKVIGYKTSDLHSVIMHLNDFHRWTREAIADWVDTIPGLMQDFTPIEPDRA